MCIYGIFRDNTWTYSSQRGKSLNPKKIQAIVQMFVPSNPQQIQVFNWMARFYKCFIKNFAFIMAPITKLMRKIKQFMWTPKCQGTWELIKQKCIKALILILCMISCSYRCIITNCRCHVSTKPNKKTWSTYRICL